MNVTSCHERRHQHRFVLPLIVLFTCTSVQSVASELVYQMRNPSFGGNPLNGSVLLNAANAENNSTDPALDEDDESALEDFNDSLQRSVLNRLTSTIASGFVDDEGNLVPGQTTTADFIIDIIDAGDGTLTVTTTDRLTGDSTSFTVQSSF